MKYIRVYKVVYILLLASNLIACFLITPTQHISAAISLGALSINAFNFIRIFQFELGKGVYVTEIVVSIGRILMILTIALRFGYISMFFSPIFQIFWMPILFSFPFETAFDFNKAFEFTALQFLCSILIFLELYYVFLLKRNRTELSQNLPVKAII